MVPYFNFAPMKKYIFSILLTLLFVSVAGFAQKPNHKYDSAQNFSQFIQDLDRCDVIIITKDIIVYTTRNFTTKKRILPAGMVCIKRSYRYFDFSSTSHDESLQVYDNYIEYYEPAQDNVPASYIPLSEFAQCVRLVHIQDNFQPNWKLGKNYTFSALLKKKHDDVITVKAIRIKDPNATLIRRSYLGLNETYRKIYMYGEIIYKVSYRRNENKDSDYFHEGKLFVNDNYDYESYLQIDNSGFGYKVDKSGKKTHVMWYGNIKDIPNHYEFLPISNTEVILDDRIYKLVKTN